MDLSALPFISSFPVFSQEPHEKQDCNADYCREEKPLDGCNDLRRERCWLSLLKTVWVPAGLRVKLGPAIPLEELNEHVKDYTNLPGQPCLPGCTS